MKLVFFSIGLCREVANIPSGENVASDGKIVRQVYESI